MKKCILTSLLLFVPFISMATDRCTNPKEYTVDRRCYVTDKQKQQKPYNAVVALIDENGEIYCTGTLAAFTGWSKSSTIPRNLITARHCVKDSVKELTVRLQDGREFSVSPKEMSDLDLSSRNAWNLFEARKDWAIYSFYGPTSVFSEISPVYIKNQDIPVGAEISVVGYGALKIMSDIEIAEFKQKYLEHLKQTENIIPGFDGKLTYEGADTGVRADGGIYAHNKKVDSFIRDTLARSNSQNNDS